MFGEVSGSVLHERGRVNVKIAKRDDFKQLLVIDDGSLFKLEGKKIEIAENKFRSLEAE